MKPLPFTAKSHAYCETITINTSLGRIFHHCLHRYSLHHQSTAQFVSFYSNVQTNWMCSDYWIYTHCGEYLYNWLTISAVSKLLSHDFTFWSTQQLVQTVAVAHLLVDHHRLRLLDGVKHVHHHWQLASTVSNLLCTPHVNCQGCQSKSTCASTGNAWRNGNEVSFIMSRLLYLTNTHKGCDKKPIFFQTPNLLKKLFLAQGMNEFLKFIFEGSCSFCAVKRFFFDQCQLHGSLVLEVILSIFLSKHI